MYEGYFNLTNRISTQMFEFEVELGENICILVIKCDRRNWFIVWVTIKFGPLYWCRAT